MSLSVRTRRAVIAGGVAVVALLLAALAFVFYFMDAVYEAEELLAPAVLPPPVLKAFAGTFEGAEGAEWKFADDLFEVAFTRRGGEEMEAYFYPDGRLERAEYPLTLEGLPARARDYLVAQPLKVAAVERVERPGAPVTYEAEIGNLVVEYDCTFDAEGNLLERIRDGSPLEEQ